MNEIELRLARLRELMKREHLSAFIFPSTDAHQSEYVADQWLDIVTGKQIGRAHV